MTAKKDRKATLRSPSRPQRKESAMPSKCRHGSTGFLICEPCAYERGAEAMRGACVRIAIRLDAMRTASEIRALPTPPPAQPDAVEEAREAFPAGSRVRVIGRHPQDGHDFIGRVGVVSNNQGHPTGAALWVWFADGYDRATRVSCPVAYLAAGQRAKPDAEGESAQHVIRKTFTRDEKLAMVGEVAKRCAMMGAGEMRPMTEDEAEAMLSAAVDALSARAAEQAEEGGSDGDRIT